MIREERIQNGIIEKLLAGCIPDRIDRYANFEVRMRSGHG